MIQNTRGLITFAFGGALCLMMGQRAIGQEVTYGDLRSAYRRNLVKTPDLHVIWSRLTQYTNAVVDYRKKNARCCPSCLKKESLVLPGTSETLCRERSAESIQP